MAAVVVGKGIALKSLLIGLGAMAGSMLLGPSGEADACALHSSAPAMTMDRALDEPLEEEEESEAEEEQEAGSLEEEERESLLRGGFLRVNGAHGSLRFGEGDAGRAYLQQSHLMVQGGVFIGQGLRVMASLPLARRSLDLPDGSFQRLQGLGDLGLEVQLGLSEFLGTGPVTVELMAGSLLPTASLARQADGEWYHPDVQLGAGVFAPRAGAALGVQLGRALGLQLGLDGIWAPPSPDGVQRSATLRGESRLRWSPLRTLGLDLALGIRHEGVSRSDGEVEMTTGGTLLAMSPALRWHPLPKWTLEAGATLPVWQGLRGGQQESVGVQVGAGMRF